MKEKKSLREKVLIFVTGGPSDSEENKKKKNAELLPREMSGPSPKSELEYKNRFRTLSRRLPSFDYDHFRFIF